MIDSKPRGNLTTAEMTRVISTYQQAVRKNFSFLKQTTRFDDLLAKSIPIEQDMGFLVPVCELHATDESLIAKLAQWRADNIHAFPDQFPATIENTKSWLRSKILDSENSMLFLILDRYGNTIGHIGFVNCINDEREMEVCNIVRGVKEGQQGIISSATKTLIDWAEEKIGPHTICSNILADNNDGIEFCRRIGFKDDRLIPLRKHEEGIVIEYLPRVENDHSEPDKNFQRMIYSPVNTIDGSQVILTAGPSISAREASYALDAARYGWNHRMNDYIKRLESTFAEYVGAKYAISTACCTGAMHIALASLGIGQGDEVIVPDITWVATGNAVTYVGATPIFADIEPDSWCLSPSSFEAMITPRTKAVMPVHLYGHPANMEKIMEIARKHNLYVVEDAAPAIGAEFQGQKTGTFGSFAAFSFQGAKLLVTGEGGMLVTNDDELYTKAYALWDQGRTPGTFWINEIGWKYKMSNIQAAIGLGQLERVDELIEAKRRIFFWYEEELKDISCIQLNYELPWARSIYWMSSFILDVDQAGMTRDELQEALKKRNIDTRPVFPAISQYPIWPKPQQSQPTAYRVGTQALNLPSGVCLKYEQVKYVCRCIQEILGKGK